MTKLENLKREAEEACRWRDHTMSRWKSSDYWPKTATASCKACGASVTVQVNPPLNGIDIGGDAVAINCHPVAP